MAEPAVIPSVDPVKIEFSPEQQAHIQKLFDQRFAAISTKKEAELKPLQDENAELKKQLEEARKTTPHVDPVITKTPDAEREQTLQLLKNEQQQTLAAKTAFDREKERADRIESVNAEILKNQAIRDAASHLENGLEFHDLPMVIELVKNSIFLDKDSGAYIVKVNGIVKQNSALMPMTLTEYFMEYAAARPYLVKSQVKGGAGSKESGTGSGQGEVGVIRSKADLTVPGDSPTARQATAARKSAYISKFGVEKFLALPAR
jgi:hypothetical protein